MKKLLLVSAAVMALGSQLPAQDTGAERIANFLYKYELDATTLTYCRLVGRNSDPFAGTIQGPARVKTTGSSTSVTENTTGQNPFANVAVGDLITVQRTPGGAVDTRVVVTRTDAANITVEAAVDWTGGFEFRYKTLQCGTTATDGWVDASGSNQITITYNIVQQNTTTGIDMRGECRGPGIGAQAVQVFPATGFQTDTTATIANQHSYLVSGRWSACRLGVKITSTDDGGDTGANAEQLTAGITR